VTGRLGCGRWLSHGGPPDRPLPGQVRGQRADPVIAPAAAEAATVRVPAWTASPSVPPIGTLLTTATAPAMVRN